MSWTTRVDKVCERWSGTPHLYGSQCRGRGVDCVRFVDAVLGELSETPPDDGLERIGPNAAMNDPAVSAKAILYLRRRYPATDVTGIPITAVEPGDVLVMREGENPSHVAIVGTDPGTAWHATRGSGVTKTGLDAWWKFVVAVYRVKDKIRW